MSGINAEFSLPSGLKLKNRLVKASMTEGLSDDLNRATPELANLYKTWAEESDVSLLLTGNVQVDRRFMERPGNVSIDLDYGEQTEQQLQQLRNYAKAGQHNNCKIFVQLGHAGRQSTALVAKKALAPSNISANAPGMGLASAVEMSEQDIKRMIEKFLFAAQVCEKTGFNGVQLHGAHGYLLSSFLNPLANNRKDEFGGSLENRAKPLMEIIRGVKKNKKNPLFSISVKLNSADFQKGGFTVDEAADVAVMLGKEKIDLLEISGGNYEAPALMTGDVSQQESGKQQSTKKREAFFLQFAAKIVDKLKHENLDLPILVTGGFRSRKIMDDAIENGSADLIGIGRPLCVDPGCTKKLLQNKIAELPRAEEAWNLPSILGWSFFQRFYIFYGMRMGGIQMSLFQNLLDIGRGKFKKPMSNDDYPNLISTMMGMQKSETAKSRSLEGYKPDDKFLQSYIKTVSKL